MSDFKSYKEEADYYKERLENIERRDKQNKRDNANIGLYLMVAGACTVIFSFLPWGKIESDATIAFALAFFIWGFVMWINGKN